MLQQFGMNPITVKKPTVRKLTIHEMPVPPRLMSKSAPRKAAPGKHVRQLNIPSRVKKTKANAE